MDAVSSSIVANASAALPGTVQGTAAVWLVKKAVDLQAASTAQLLEALPQTALATSGSVGTQVNTVA